MNYHNEYSISPGCYEHHKGLVFVLLDLVTHTENAITGDMEKMDDPEVVYRDLVTPVEHFEGKLTQIHRRYKMKLSEWNLIMDDGKKRFAAI